MLLSRNAATVIAHIHHQHQITLTRVNSNPFIRFRDDGSVMVDHVNCNAAYLRNGGHGGENCVPHPARIGIRRMFRMGLISIARDDHPVGVRRGVVGGGVSRGLHPWLFTSVPLGLRIRPVVIRVRWLIPDWELIPDWGLIPRRRFIPSHGLMPHLEFQRNLSSFLAATRRK